MLVQDQRQAAEGRGGGGRLAYPCGSEPRAQLERSGAHQRGGLGQANRTRRGEERIRSLWGVCGRSIFRMEEGGEYF